MQGRVVFRSETFGKTLLYHRWRVLRDQTRTLIILRCMWCRSRKTWKQINPVPRSMSGWQAQHLEGAGQYSGSAAAWGAAELTRFTLADTGNPPGSRDGGAPKASPRALTLIHWLSTVIWIMQALTATAQNPQIGIYYTSDRSTHLLQRDIDTRMKERLGSTLQHAVRHLGVKVYTRFQSTFPFLSTLRCCYLTLKGPCHTHFIIFISHARRQ